MQLLEVSGAVRPLWVVRRQRVKVAPVFSGERERERQCVCVCVCACVLACDLSFFSPHFPDKIFVNHIALLDMSFRTIGVDISC